MTVHHWMDWGYLGRCRSLAGVMRLDGSTSFSRGGRLRVTRAGALALLWQNGSITTSNERVLSRVTA